MSGEPQGPPPKADRHQPSVIGCAIGFGAAGSGVGSLVGMAVGPHFFPQLPEGQGTNEEKIAAAYGGTFWGIGLGIAAGIVVGVLYAVLVQWVRRKRRVAATRWS